MNFIVDTGTTVNLIEERDYRRLEGRITLRKSSTKIFPYDDKVPLKILELQRRDKVAALGKDTLFGFFYIGIPQCIRSLVVVKRNAGSVNEIEKRLATKQNTIDGDDMLRSDIHIQEMSKENQTFIRNHFSTMKVLSVFVCFISVLLAFNNNVSAKPIAGNKKNACTEKKFLNDSVDAIKRDLGALFQGVTHNLQNTTVSRIKDMFSNFSKVENLSQDKLVERLYLHHQYLKKAFASFGRTSIGVKIYNIIVQIKNMGELLQNKANCNPGQIGTSFVFALPQYKPPRLWLTCMSQGIFTESNRRI